MPGKSRFDFQTHDAWLAYVATEVPRERRRYVRASARIELFRCLYQSLGTPFPTDFQEELEHITEPERTAALETLNDSTFGHLIAQLLNRAQQGSARNERQEAASSQEQIRDLLEHLAHNNPYFALWIDYKKRADDRRITEHWGEYLARKIGIGNTESIAFTHAMAELGTLLHYYQDKHLHLPDFLFERIWFLHLLRSPERMAHTRAVFGTLTAELAACTSE